MEAKLKKLNKKLQKKAEKDQLTSLYNYGEIMNILEKEINRCSHINSSLSIMMIDIDNFSEVNNKYGHVKGDKVIAAVAERIKKSIRKMDSAGRFGGDEFLIVLPDTNLARADELLYQVKKADKDGIIAAK
ncbi:MAG: GGDEF domain-containing protein [Halanaerobium sp.]